MSLKKLTAGVVRSETDTAQRFLTSAFGAVDGVLKTLRQLRSAKTSSGGRLTGPEEDLLRAAILFAGAGLDSTVKRLIRDSLPNLLDVNAQAHDKFESFAANRIHTAEVADPQILARYLTAENPRAKLIDDYIYAMTGSSLQSVEELDKTAGALGIDDAELRKRIRGLKPLFIARNKIAHELDLQQPEKPGHRSRQSRTIDDTKSLCQDALDVTQLIVNETARILSAGKP